MSKHLNGVLSGLTVSCTSTWGKFATMLIDCHLWFSSDGYWKVDGSNMDS